MTIIKIIFDKHSYENKTISQCVIDEEIDIHQVITKLDLAFKSNYSYDCGQYVIEIEHNNTVFNYYLPSGKDHTLEYIIKNIIQSIIDEIE